MKKKLVHQSSKKMHTDNLPMHAFVVMLKYDSLTNFQQMTFDQHSFPTLKLHLK